MNLSRRQLLLTSAMAAIEACAVKGASAQPSDQFVPRAYSGVVPNLIGQTNRARRYRPQGLDFVIANGEEFFNRPLYGGNTAFRVDGGDKPEFVMYLPGRGGNLRFAIQTAAGRCWLHQAQQTVSRYRPGELHYELRDPTFGRRGLIRIIALAHYQTEGLIVRMEGRHLAANSELIWAYGGVNGERGVRDGDIGTERVPISEYFQFRNEIAHGNRIEVSRKGIMLSSPAARIWGAASSGARWFVSDAANWNDLHALIEAKRDGVNTATDRPIAVGCVALGDGSPVYVSLQRLAKGTVSASELDTYREVSTQRESTRLPPVTLPGPYSAGELPALFALNRRYFMKLRNHVRIKTPDPYVNAAMAALNIASDAVWDGPQQAIMHGAIAWRAKLLGWRGPYALDALGWHDRAKKNFDGWVGKQNRDPIPASIPPADTASNLSRNEAGLHSNGDISNSHYDMNMVFIDALFRHFLWTGDREFAREVWPVIKRHLAWERRLFRREFGSTRLPLYEAYASIWASDDIQYGGGGVTYTSAYNQFHNRMAARIARWLGEDPSPFVQEADLIAEAMQTFLWLPEKGQYAEYKDFLGHQAVHSSAGLWSFYHSADSGALSPRQAWAMAESVHREFAHIPVQGPGVPADADYFVFPTTDWMPYTWSANNVVFGENLHTALGFWQAGHAERAYTLMKSALLASMYMGVSPGNVGTMNYLDVYRRESQRDFADGAGVMARTLIEGLFGIRPDALSGVLQVSPGFPRDWREASLVHRDLGMRFTRAGTTDRWEIRQHRTRFSRLTLRLPALHEDVQMVSVNGRLAAWRCDPEAVGRPILEVDCALGRVANVIVKWKGPVIGADAGALDKEQDFARIRRGAFTWWARAEPALGAETPGRPQTDWRSPLMRDVLCVDLSSHFNDRVTEIFKPGKYRSPRSAFVSLALPSQGIGAWAGHVNAAADIDDSGLRGISAANGGKFLLPNGVPFLTPGPGTSLNVVFTSQWDNYPREARIDLNGRASHLHLLMVGSTNHMQSRMDNAEVIVTYKDGNSARLGLHNPTTWWPVEQDYFIDDYQFRCPAPLPPRVDLRTGKVRLLNLREFKGQGGVVPGGAATVLGMSLDNSKALDHLIVRALANDVVIGLMAVTLEQP
jgi:hypothetical protein